ncbi:MAG: putative ubiquitin-protein ligase, cullin 4 [Streblomastix strix]|uniref:Putative ubiquitin-protein ligase, cullin 4 n=1 Tax=Streblomastix strix TaxID=222440 RepID=A0A5J4W3Y0_9EUKA|nr:MAG: putative ubiquitin-protein ligase, cullin 4 [Streblomastix strix]
MSVPNIRFSFAPHKKNPDIAAQYQRDLWAKLEKAVRIIYSDEQGKFSEEELYRTVVSICTNGDCGLLYAQLTTLTQEFINAKFIDIAKQAADLDSEEFVKLILRTWEEHLEHTKLIKTIFTCLDRKYCFQINASIWDMNIIVFRNALTNPLKINISKIKDRIIQEQKLNSQYFPSHPKLPFTLQQNNNTVDLSICQLLVLYISRSIYKERLSLFIHASSTIDGIDQDSNAQDILIPANIGKVSKMLGDLCLQSEINRSLTCLARRTLSILIEIIDRELILNQFPFIMDKQVGIGLLIRQRMGWNVNESIDDTMIDKEQIKEKQKKNKKKVKKQQDKNDNIDMDIDIGYQQQEKGLKYQDNEIRIIEIQHRDEDLQRIYRLALRVGQLQVLAKTFYEIIVDLGSKRIADTTRDNQLVSDLLRLTRQLRIIIAKDFSGMSDDQKEDYSKKNQYTSMDKDQQQDNKHDEDSSNQQDQLDDEKDLIHSNTQDENDRGVMKSGILDHDLNAAIAASSGSEFDRGLKQALSVFINQRQNKPAELLAKFTHKLMVEGNKRFSDDEIELIIDDFTYLFSAVDGKDVFETFYKLNLAKRLCYQESSSSELERSLLLRLRSECGENFTQNLETMFNDVEVSSNIIEQFKSSEEFQDRIKDNSDPNTSFSRIDFRCLVLTSTAWPSFHHTSSQPTSGSNTVIVAGNISPIIMPNDARDLQDAFCSFYMTRYHNRKLVYNPVLGHCQVRVTISNGRIREKEKINQSVMIKDDIESDIQSNNAIEYNQISSAQANAQIRKELHISLIQAAILMLYETQSEDGEQDVANEAQQSSSSNSISEKQSSHIILSLSLIQQQTRVDLNELKLAIAALCIHPAHILIYENNNINNTITNNSSSYQQLKDVDESVDWMSIPDDAQFMFNDDLAQYKKTRIKVNQYQVKEKSGESNSTNSQIIEDRQHVLEAQIVRVMKLKKQMSYNPLISEVSSHVRFSVSKSDMKKRVESLIERGYLERDATDPEKFNYLA